jgi:tetratricopeptide (TPR) repeat protein
MTPDIHVDAVDNFRLCMHSQDSHPTAAQAVSIAIRQCDSMAPGSPVAEALARLMPSAEFWVEAAAELHRRDRHFDALDCWNLALQKDPEVVNRRDMASTLSAVSTGDDLFSREALRQYEQTQDWQHVAYLRFRLNFEGNSVLSAIESALDTEPDLEWDDFWEFGYSTLTSWHELGLYYLENKQKSKALYCFGKALISAPDDLAQATYIAKAIGEQIQVDIYGREI